MMRRSHLAIAALLLTVLSAIAQDATSESECANRFKTSDLNGDGVLTPTEIPKASQLPAALSKEVLIGRKEYIAACAKLLQAQAPKTDAKEQSASPETKGQQQPQGATGPLETKSGGAPAESPQGQTPPGMQAATQGSSKSTVDPEVKK